MPVKLNYKEAAFSRRTMPELELTSQKEISF